ncbi:MAG: 16S rRNA (uracil(1498)-N(3))-methyltransferase [Actinomycetota bacterium]|nr:16S rRNA (uracil(1498)-N(3))-methyltransferase [Actinomycetota bacterium]
MSAPVFLAGHGTLDGIEAGHTYLLDGTEGRHAGVVQRRGVGERIDVVDGAGVRLHTVVEEVASHGLTLRVEAREIEPSPEPALVLVQALAKGDRDELAVEAATELGVDAVVPWQAERSVVVWRGERAAKSQARWRATVRGAVKQSRRAREPEVEDPVDSKALAHRVERTVASGGAALVLHESADDGVAGALSSVAAARGEVLVVVGPEGGISDRELEALVAAGALAVRLGPHVLRTSTAGPAALALLAHHLGRW